MRAIYLLLRAGQPSAAAALAARCGAAWRAASMSGAGVGWVPAQATADASDDLDGSEGILDDAEAALAADVLAAQGGAAAQRYGTDACAARARWRAACAAVVQAARLAGAGGEGVQARLHEIEAAVYGALAGNVEAVLPMCECWEDDVWAHARALLQVLPEERLQRTAMGGTDGQGHSAPGRKRPWDVVALAGSGAGSAGAPRGPAPADVAKHFLVRCSQIQTDLCLIFKSAQRLRSQSVHLSGVQPRTLTTRKRTRVQRFGFF